MYERKIMKSIQYVVAFGVSLMMVGCMHSSSISTENMQIVKLENGKSYKVPKGAVYTKSPVTSQAIQFYKVMDVKNCKNGDITWEDPSIADRINKIMRSGTKQEGIAMYVDAAKANEIGCASPLQ